MSRVPGECLDSWLRRRAKEEDAAGRRDGPSAVRRGCGLAIALLRQLGPTLSRISAHEIANRVSFWLIDFGLAVEAQSWPEKWPQADVAGDCRYWAPASFVMSFCGPEDGGSGNLHIVHLDIVGLGLTALELLCSTALASRKTWGPDGLRGSWERLLETWERYREDVTRWHSMIFQVFTKGGSEHEASEHVVSHTDESLAKLGRSHGDEGGLPLRALGRDASPRSIERAWRQQARMHHPDKVPEAEKLAAEERFKRLSEAHDLLADPERRELYDRFGIQDGATPLATTV
eukprot:g21726.t1